MFTVLDEDGTEVSDPALRQRHCGSGESHPGKSRALDQWRDSAGFTAAQRTENARQRQPQRPQEDGLTAVLNVTASDRPGLLANIALVLVELGLEITSARITTLGERVEDVFLVTRCGRGEHQRCPAML
jgi:[protein-PII] uridylyltransferase